MTQAAEPTAATVLDDIHQALLARQFDRLAALSLALDRALSHPPQKLDAASLGQIRSKAERNAATMTAVQRGIKAALRRVAEIRSVSNGLVTYDKAGHRHDAATSALAQRLYDFAQILRNENCAFRRMLRLRAFTEEAS